MRRILVTDDSATMRSLLVSTIESCGDYEVIEAASGFEALRLLPREKIDLIITDINMPDINGLELIRYVRNNANYTQTPLFIISTEGREKDVEKGLSLGANEYLVKPIIPQKLQELIAKYIG
jgi:two-component system chemotaxis response regulator CheY